MVQEELQENGNNKAVFDVSKLTVFLVTVNDRTTTKTTTKIIELIINNPHISRQELSEIIGISINGINWHIKRLKANGILTREGGRKRGKWIINENK